MANAPNQAYATAIAQAIAHGQGTPQQRAAFLGQVANQMRANAGHPVMRFPGPIGGGQSYHPAAPTGGAGLAPAPHPVAATYPALPAAGNPSGGAGLAPPGHINPGGPMGTINPGGGIHPIGPARPGGALPIGRSGPVKPIGPARPGGRGAIHWYGPGGSGAFQPQ